MGRAVGLVAAVVVLASLLLAMEGSTLAEITDFESLKTAFLSMSTAFDNLEARVKKLEDDKRLVCERGMNLKTGEPSVILTDAALEKEIRCDAQTDGGGWIVFQRRTTGNMDFNRKWTQYRDGFGDLNTEFWLGNEALYKLTNDHTYELRVDVHTKDGLQLFNTYKPFRIESENDLYRLRLGSLSGETLGEMPGDGFSHINNMAFTTSDRDNDMFDAVNCASSGGGGFWYKACAHIYPNSDWARVFWNTGYRVLFPNFIEMKIRRIQV